MIKNLLLHALFIISIVSISSCQKSSDRGYTVLYSVSSKNPISVTYSNGISIRTITQNNGIWSTSFDIPKEKYASFIISIKVVTKGEFYLNIYQNGFSHRVYKSYDSINVIY